MVPFFRGIVCSGIVEYAVVFHGQFLKVRGLGHLCCPDKASQYNLLSLAILGINSGESEKER